ncbi:interferon-induced protein 44-like [Mugil cephalus]|uniref:interferon-induced protein 44-like n=1 Tax=Mugil cephalus TaxID=48193 RepID=UPI001FB62DDC|nr:interferon-induced protein 44-like [Mugil cephalus]XP_047442391.1 interferon-induced protein 44-like [Mugil cephalus]
MNPRLTATQQRTICSQLGKVKLQLLYKASVHGYTSAAFHQRCDNRSPTVSVGYNASGFVFGGYTKQPFSQSGQYVQDDQAFLFILKGENLLRYPVTQPAYAVRMMKNSGPYFGEDLALAKGNNAVVYSSPRKYYNFNAAEMHGNDLNLTECEVYQVEEDTTLLERPWRPIIWNSERRTKLMESIKTHKPIDSSVSQVRVLLVGPVGAGKSSFFNSVNSVFRGHVTSQAMCGSSATSLTTQFRAYPLKDGREGKHLPIILCDTMGLEESTGAGLDINDISSILKGHLSDRYQFNSRSWTSWFYNPFKSQELKDKIHCVAYVIDACKVSIMPANLEEKLNDIRSQINSMGIPQLVLLTKVDEACPQVKQDVTNIYSSTYIKEMAEQVSARLGVPLSHVIPFKNYSEELELDLNCDILILSAINQMLRLADDYFDDEKPRSLWCTRMYY